MSRVVRAKTAGFCMGVILALRKLDALVEGGAAGRRICTLGPIIHNPQVLAEYAAKGVVTADSPADIPPGATVVIRAHGVPKNILETLKESGVEIVDATCPKVKKAQLLIATEAREGRVLLLFGEETHAEVKGLLSYAEAGAFVFDSRAKLDAFPLEKGTRYCLAAQTTQDRDSFDAIAGKLESSPTYDVKVLHTICDATRERQDETVRIAGDVDFMIVVGGFDSGNTRRLVQVATGRHKHCLHVESARDLPLDELSRVPKIGLTAGASTPKSLIDEIHRLLESGEQSPGWRTPADSRELPDRKAAG